MEEDDTVFGQNNNIQADFGKLRYGCEHYRRRCKLRAPCCNQIFTCRHCHNAAMGAVSNPKDRHELVRQDVSRVICAVCDTEQQVAHVCSNCGVKMGEYFCAICKFFDDDTEKKQFHCDDCGICRVGGRDKFFHCKKCEMEVTYEVQEKQAQEIPENIPQKKQETRDEMLARHRKEISQLQDKETALKKAAAKGSKAEQKAKKKQVEEEISGLSAKLKEKHVEELSSLGYNTSNGNEKGNLDSLVKAIAGVSVATQSDHSKPSKSVKRREKRAQQEAAREQRIQEEQSNIVSDRMIESEKLERKLEPLGLTINEIKPDGHCLYRAVEDQMALLSGGPSPYTYQELREMVGAYMRKHSSDFLPFFLSENMTDGDSDDSLTERFENYCREVESTAAWGGQLELGALTHCLKKHIMIFSGSFPDVEMGKEYKSDSGSGSPNPSIKLSYHKHAFGLGEHYNSVVPS